MNSGLSFPHKRYNYENSSRPNSYWRPSKRNVVCAASGIGQVESLLVWMRQAREGGSDCEIYICSFSTSYHLSFLSQPLFLFQGPYMVLPLVSNVKQIATTELNISFHSSNSSFTSSIVSETLKACLTSSWSTALPGGQSASCTSVFVCQRMILLWEGEVSISGLKR